MTKTFARISDEAVAEATGRDWNGWFGTLDARHAEELDHTAIVALVEDEGIESGWWCQTVAVGYEQARGLRRVGETADAGFQVGVQRTMSVSRDRLWELLVDPVGRAAWIGDVQDVDLTPGRRYETAEGTTGEIRTIKPGERLRLTWQPPNRDDPTTLELTVSGAVDGAKSTLQFHHEKLADADDRAAMRDHWREVLDEIEAEVSEGSKR